MELIEAADCTKCGRQALRLIKSQLAFLLVIVFLFFCANASALNPFDYSPFALFVPVWEEIRSGNIITGFAHQIFMIFVSGFDPVEVEYFTDMLNLFSPKKYLIVQDFKVHSSEVNKNFLIKVFCPRTILPFQKKLWQGKTCSSRIVFQGEGNIIFSSGKEKETRIKVCTLVNCEFYSFVSSNLALPENIVRESTTREISRKFKRISDIEDFIAFFGTFSPNGRFLPIQYILLNPFNIDCSEFSTLLFEFFSDKGLDVRYSLGVSTANRKNYGGLHCWISVVLNNQRIEIDPTLGRKIGKLAYCSHFPIQINFTELNSVEELSNFPISFISTDGTGIVREVNSRFKLTVYEFQRGGDVW